MLKAGTHAGGLSHGGGAFAVAACVTPAPIVCFFIGTAAAADIDSILLMLYRQMKITMV